MMYGVHVCRTMENTFFAETAERLLCLEYMPKGSLGEYLSGCFSVPSSFKIVVRQV